MWPFAANPSSSISDRLNALRAAEGRLLDYARTRFGGGGGVSRAGGPRRDEDDDDDIRDDENDNYCRYEFFDTPIPIPSVIRGGRRDDDVRKVDDGGGRCNAGIARASSRCQVGISPKRNGGEERGGGGEGDGTIHDDDSRLTLHGVRVTNDRRTTFSTRSKEEEDDNGNSKPPPPLVLLHGYANGSLYFYRNLHGLSTYFGNVYALDMLGWGLSSRPKFDLTSRSPIPSTDDVVDGMTRDKVRCAESFFVESLERWRMEHSISKFTLAGHSMGGYLATAYAERYPHRVHKLLLLSPVGVPRRPSPEEEARMMNRLPFYARYPLNLARHLFERWGTTPGDFLRSLPHSKSRSMVESYVDRRLPSLSCPDEKNALGEYLYQNSMLPGSGEYCLSELLTVGAYAKVPLVDRIPKILVPPSRCSSSSSTTRDDGDDDGFARGDDAVVGDADGDGMEVHMIYGQRDWMDYRGGLEAQRACRERREEWEKMAEKGGGGGVDGGAASGPPPPRVYVHGVRDAGHLLMLDNHEEFNAAVILAAGGDADGLPSRPVEFVYRDGVPSHGGGDDDFDSGRSRSLNSGRGEREVLVGEDGAASFFRGPRWNKDDR
jgi:pimeloyl-ACP methyl ester carboxylesterase